MTGVLGFWGQQRDARAKRLPVANDQRQYRRDRRPAR